MTIIVNIHIVKTYSLQSTVLKDFEGLTSLVSTTYLWNYEFDQLCSVDEKTEAQRNETNLPKATWKGCSLDSNAAILDLESVFYHHTMCLLHNSNSETLGFKFWQDPALTESPWKQGLSFVIHKIGTIILILL